MLTCGLVNSPRHLPLYPIRNIRSDSIDDDGVDLLKLEALLIPRPLENEFLQLLTDTRCIFEAGRSLEDVSSSSVDVICKIIII